MNGFDWALQQMQSHVIVRRQAWAEKGLILLLVNFGGRASPLQENEDREHRSVGRHAGRPAGE